MLSSFLNDAHAGGRLPFSLLPFSALLESGCHGLAHASVATTTPKGDDWRQPMQNSHVNQVIQRCPRRRKAATKLVVAQVAVGKQLAWVSTCPGPLYNGNA